MVKTASDIRISKQWPKTMYSLVFDLSMSIMGLISHMQSLRVVGNDVRINSDIRFTNRSTYQNISIIDRQVADKKMGTIKRIIVGERGFFCQASILPKGSQGARVAMDCRVVNRVIGPWQTS